MLKKNLVLAVGLALIGVAHLAQAADDSNKAEDPAAARELSLREQNNISGTTGLLHLALPSSGADGTFRVSILGDGYAGHTFLCTPSTPCGASTRDHASHFGTAFGISATPLAFFEAYGSLRSFANHDDQYPLGVIDVLNNAALGVKFFTPEPFGVFSFGGSAELDLLNGSGAVGFHAKSTSGHLTALGALDFRELPGGGVPLRVLANFSYFLDNSGKELTKTEANRGAPVTRIERWGLGVNRVDQVQMGLGVEGLFGIARPFLEWNLGIPFNRQRYTCLDHLPYSGDGCLGTDHTFSVIPSALTVGARVTPWLPGLTGTLAVDIGTSGTSNFIEELAPTLPWDIWFGVGYAFDVVPPEPKKVVVTAPPAPAPPKVELRARGFVHEQERTEGIAGAIVKYREGARTAMVSGDDGHFTTEPLPPGSYGFEVTAEGYKPGECTVRVSDAQPLAPKAPAPGTANAPGAANASNGPNGASNPPDAHPTPATPPATPAPKDGGTSLFDVDCALEALPRVGTVSGRITDADSGAPVGGANVELTDSMHRSLALTTDDSGTFHFGGVVPGAVTVKADAATYLFRSQTATLAARQDAHVDVALRKKPKVSLVQVGATELKIKQQIHFEKDSATILEDSGALLEQIADALARTPSITHVEIQGHTDDSGTPEHNKALSEARAGAVLDWLVSHGIDPSRLSARGYGQERPLSPNVTPQGRARNRRVQFIIEH
jgi:outer membrane protein OmpA-like peptidoglycan-associated protein